MNSGLLNALDARAILDRLRGALELENDQQLASALFVAYHTVRA